MLFRSRATRDLVDYTTTMFASTDTCRVQVINISPLGLMARTPSPLKLGDLVQIDLPIAGKTAATIRWIENGRIGTEFRTPVSPERYELMLNLLPRRKTNW